MPSPTTALAIIRGALGLTNAVGSDQTLTADEVSDSLGVFNDLLEDWSTQDLAVFGQANQTFNTIANQKVYTISADMGADWVASARPVRINAPAYSTIQSVTFPYSVMSQGQYNLIAYKDQTGGGTDINQRYLYVNDFPLGLITLWPVPMSVFPITFTIDRVLDAVASAGDVISFPPGYSKAFKYCIGVELAPLFGKKITDYPDVLAIAKDTFSNIQLANRKPRIMTYDLAYGDLPTGYFNWRGGM